MASKNSSKKTPFLLLLPFILMMVIFAIGFLSCLLTSLGYMPTFGKTTLTLDYIIQTFKDKAVIESIQLSCYIALVTSALAIIGGVLLSWCLVTVCKGKGILNMIARFPILVPSAVASLFVIQMFSSTGLTPRLLETVGLPEIAGLFNHVLYEPNSFGIMLSYLWKEIPFCCYMVLTTMSGISDTYGEAAINLGASRWQAFRKVVLPHCLPAARNAFMIILAVTFGFYEVPFLLGGTVPRALPVLAFNEYRDPNFIAHRPEAMAISIVMVLISILISLTVYLVCEHYFKKRGLSIHGQR